MKLLIVEDEEILLKVLREKFEKEKFDVEVAVNGEEALAMAESFKPDLMLLDIILPKKDGLKVLAELKADPEIQNIPVIVLSNLGDDEKIKTALSLGAVDYMVKTQHPINEVVEKVNEYLMRAK
jgi:two-component system, OmpR family, phosphate regulon response regulator PhoB